MKKKHLNKRQLNRIDQRQKAHGDLAEQATGPAHAPGAADPGIPGAEDGPQRQGRVLSHYGQQLDVEALDGDDRGCVYRCFQRSNLEPLVTGDRVIFRPGDPTGIVVAGLERDRILQRPNKYGELKPVAANIDQIVIVIAPAPEPHVNLIDRYLVAAEASRIRPMLLLNKADLIQSASPQTRASLQAIIDLYASLGYRAATVSCRQAETMPGLQAMLTGHTSIFVGQSGVGKSALVNALLPDAGTREGRLSHAASKGRHTTTSARLYHLPAGGALIDSPGIREFGLWHMAPEALIEGFVEFRPFIGQCRFRDCRHDNTDHCRILQAVNEGLIDPRRLESFQMICNSMEAEHRI